jgi:hypothetical protein
MAIPMYGGVGDLFNRVGKIGALIKNTRSYQATQLTSMTSVFTCAIQSVRLTMSTVLFGSAFANTP